MCLHGFCLVPDLSHFKHALTPGQTPPVLLSTIAIHLPQEAERNIHPGQTTPSLLPTRLLDRPTPSNVCIPKSRSWVVGNYVFRISSSPQGCRTGRYDKITSVPAPAWLNRDFTHEGRPPNCALDEKDGQALRPSRPVLMSPFGPEQNAKIKTGRSDVQFKTKSKYCTGGMDIPRVKVLAVPAQSRAPAHDRNNNTECMWASTAVSGLAGRACLAASVSPGPHQYLVPSGPLG